MSIKAEKKMSTKYKNYAADFKARVALDAIKGEMTVNQITTKYGIHSTQIVRWKQQALEAIKKVFCSKGRTTEKSEQLLIEQLS